MAYEFDVQGWEDWDGNQHWGKPDESELENVAGLFSEFWDDETGEPHHHHWVYYDSPMDDWQGWWDLIELEMNDHGYATA